MKNISILFKTVAFAVLGLLLVGCNEDLVYDKEDVGAPVVTDFSPKSGIVGTEVKLTGEYLQRLDTVYIGGQLAEIKYLINSNEAIVLVTAASKTGHIEVSGAYGKFETTQMFTVEYAVPSLTVFPTSAKVNDQIFIEGNNMNAITAVYFGTVKATIVAQTAKDITVQVPAFTDASVDILFDYNVASGVAQTGTTGKPFSLVP